MTGPLRHRGVHVMLKLRLEHAVARKELRVASRGTRIAFEIPKSALD